MRLDLQSLLTSLWQPAHFYLARGLRCAWQFEAEQSLHWELFRGRLVAPEQTRETKSFLTWNILPVIDGAIGDSPLLSLLFDEAEMAIHVTRGIHCRVWRAVDAGGGIESEQTETWVRELVGTLFLQDAPTSDVLIREMRSLIWHAIVGTSRLPLMSLEAPLPQFTFGQLAYLPHSSLAGIDARLPRRTWQECLATTIAIELDESSTAKLLEILLRSAPVEELPALAYAFAEWHGANRLAATFRRMFNEVSLSPYTDFVDRAIGMLAAWDIGDEVDVLTSLLRRIARHLTAYDLVLFHYRGANFPDALLLDALLRRLIDLSAERRDLFIDESPAGRLRRRALRMGVLLRSHYEGHAVPDQPTSPGENARIFPGAYEPVPDEQIDEPRSRSRRLYQDVPLASLLTPAFREILSHSCRDLAELDELREGGMALFIDRPLGFYKAPAETDQTPLLSYEAFSRRLATRRLLDIERLANDLGIDLPSDFWQPRRDQLAEMSVAGLSLDRVPELSRPAVSLADARKVADDFVVLRTTASSLRAFWAALSIEPGPWPIVARVVDESGKPVLGAFDSAMRLCAEFEGDWSDGSIVRGGAEIPRAGLRWSLRQQIP